jgi:hypothetical protein
MERSKMKIYIDLDDTLLYWLPEYIDWLYSNKFKDIDTHNPDTWFKLSYVIDYNNNYEHIDRFKTPLGKWFMHYVNMNPEIIYKVIIITARNLDVRSIKHVKKTIEENFNFDIDFICTGRFPKHYFISTENILIDDKRQTLQDCQNKGIITYHPNELDKDYFYYLLDRALHS